MNLYKGTMGITPYAPVCFKVLAENEEKAKKLVEEVFSEMNYKVKSIELELEEGKVIMECNYE
jgi:hypothetical protein